MLNKSLMIAAIVALTPAFALAEAPAGKPVAAPGVTSEAAAAATTDANGAATTKAVTHKAKKAKKTAKPTTAVPAPVQKPDTHS